MNIFEFKLIQNAYRWFFSSLANQLLFSYLLVVTVALFASASGRFLMIKTESMKDLNNSLEVAAVNWLLK
jgi:hypothetical protein